MAIADRINEMYTHVEDVYDTITNVDLPTNKNIQNIPSTMRNSYLEIMNNGIDKIWNNWEKVTGSGTDISLSPTLEAPMRNVLNGNTYQFTTTGKNLLENTFQSQTANGITFTRNDDGSLSFSGTATQAHSITGRFTNEMIFRAGVTYIFSLGNKQAGYGVYLQKTGNVNVWYLGVSVTNSSLTITPTEDTTIQQLAIHFPNGNTVNGTIYPMVRLSSVTDSTYEPYTGGQASPNPQYPQDVHVVSGDNTIKVTGKNLAYMKNGTYTYNHNTGVISNNNIMTLNTSGSTGSDSYFSFANGYTTQWAPTSNIQGINDMNLTSNGGDYVATVITNKTMPSAVNIYFWTSKGRNWQRRIDTYTKVVATMSLDADEHIKDIGIWVAGSSNVFENYTIQVQLEKGSTATDYEPYSSNSYNIDLPVENLLDLTSLFYRTNGITSGDMASNSFVQNGTASWSNTWFYYKNDKKNTNYTLSMKALSSLARRTGFSIYGVSDTEQATNPTIIITNWLDISANVKGETSQSFNSGNYEYIMLRFWNNGTATALSSNVALYISDVQLEKGSKQNNFTPYGTTPIELCDFNTYKDNFLRTSGKNLFDKDNANIVNAFINPTGYVLQANDNMRTLYIPCKPNTTYTVSKIQSARFVLGTSNTIEIGSSMTNGRNNFTATQLTITSGANDTYLLVFFYNGNADTLTPQQILDTIQIEEGTTATTYEPYGSGEWYYKEAVIKKILNGTETGVVTPWTRNQNGNSIYYFYFSPATSEKKVVGYNILCDILPCFNESMWNYSSYRYAIGGSINNETINIMLADSSINTVDLFKTWLGENLPCVYYALATPNYTKITYEPLLEQLEAFYNAKSKNSQTNITQENNDLPFIIDSTMLKEV